MTYKREAIFVSGGERFSDDSASSLPSAYKGFFFFSLSI